MKIQNLKDILDLMIKPGKPTLMIKGTEEIIVGVAKAGKEKFVVTTGDLVNFVPGMEIIEEYAII